MAASYGAGGQSPSSLSRPIERVFEDAQHTGEILLSGRKLRDYPKIASKYDLVDTISTDLSKNRFSEVPKEVCNYMSMEKLNCYNNVIKSIPEALVQLQALTHLNLSRNQLSIIPPFISQLQALEVLIASHNKLVSLPEEIGVLDKLMELDVSCNEISHLPLQIGDLKSLKSLNVRRNFLVELPLEISKLNLRKLDFSSNRISKIPTVFRKIETLEEMILDYNPLTLPPAHVCTKGKQHIMKYLQIEAIREDKKRGIMNRKSLPPQQSLSSEEFRNLMESPENRWKRHTVLSSDSGYSTTDSLEKCGFSPSELAGVLSPIVANHARSSETNGDLEEANNLALKAAAAAREQRYSRDGEQRRGTRERVPSESGGHAGGAVTSPVSSGYQSPQMVNYTSPKIQTYPSPQAQVSQAYPPSPLTPQTPPTPQGPGPGVPEVETTVEDAFTRELQRQKLEYEQKKKLAEQLRLQQEEEEREERRRAALRVQEEQRALLERQREDARLQEEARLHAEEARLQEEARLREAEEMARRAEEERQIEEARRAAEQQKVENKVIRKIPIPAAFSFYFYSNNNNMTSPLRETVHEYGSYNHHTDSMPDPYQNYSNPNYLYRKPALSSNSFKEERKASSNGRYRRTVSDTAGQRLQSPDDTAATNPPPPPPKIKNGPVDLNNSAALSNTSSPNTSYNSHGTPSPHGAPHPGTGPSQPPDRRPTTPQGSVTRRTKVADRVSTTAPSRTGTSRPAASSGPGRSAAAAGKKNHLTPEEELRAKTQTIKSQQQAEAQKARSRVEEQRLKQVQKEAVNSYVSRRSSTSSEDSDKKRSTPTRTVGYSAPSRQTGSGMSSSARSTASSRTTTTSRTTSSRTTTPTAASSTGRVATRTGSGTSSSAQSAATRAKRGGTVLTNTTMKMLENYKDVDPNFTIRRQQDQQREEMEQMEMLRKTIETRLKRTLPDNLSEALSDGVLLCHLANQIRPRSVSSVHVPSPAVPKLTPAKCRRNVDYFLEACRKIGVNKEQICSSSDILEERGVNRVAITVAALVAIATNPKHSVSAV